MWITKSIAARTLIWLAAITVPAQSLPAASCGCVGDASCCEQRSTGQCRCTGAKICRCGDASPCRKLANSCCGGRVAKATCCSTDNSVAFSEHTCNCGEDCQCGTSQEPKPATPPIENNNPTEQVTVDATSVAFDVTVYFPQITKRHADACIGAVALAALNRCVSLCRFTL